jgi:arylsulfatase A-like enzyme
MQSKPNILRIMADQLILFLTDPYGLQVVQVPALNRLPIKGVTFDTAYQVCRLASVRSWKTMACA